MAALVTQISTALTRVGTEFKSVRATIGDLSSLTTTQKSSIVAALNELKSAASSAAGINDTTSGSSSTYSSSKVISLINQAKSDIVNGAPAALDTLLELNNALGGDANFAATVTGALGSRVRTDTATQGLTATQQSNARTNIDTYGKADIGDPTTDLLAVFVASLV